MAWSLSQIAELVEEVKSLGCLEQLVGEAAHRKLVVRVPPETVNFVKSFLFREGHHKKSLKARDIIVSAHCFQQPQVPDGGPPLPPDGPPRPDAPPPF
ncbi:hypothetical protein AAW51_4108 [Caldimonas brevitalea]|uniref:Uncharacterized protein n=2 Tax=Caldimonas brevitalea TaxID=413882 RepID=A0A0G3BMY6_9BURK|nr:hypothetical protein AAW51_4108 [Caldimonas brevitalea]